jgi:beta-lactam-binding protein with PASTA domain
VKVMDFGIARMLAGPDTVEQTAAVLGTAAYLSPEQAQGQAVDARSDLYSLGVVLYEMLTGKPPFTGDSAMAVAYKHVQETPLPPSTLNADVPPRLDAVVMRALAKNPANRYQSAAEFREDLQRVIDGQEVQATPLLPAEASATQVISRPSSTMVMPPAEPEDERRTWLVVLITVLVLLILAGGAYLLAHSLLSDNTPAVPVTVPSVVGETEAQATSDLLAKKLKVTNPSLTQIVNDPAKVGTVLLQDPPAGNQVPAGTTVTLTIGKAPKTISVPDVTGMTVPEAQATLLDNDLTLGNQTTAPSDTGVKEGDIISQDPVAGSDAKKGDPVDVVVSTGPTITTVTVPDVTCLSFGQAKKQLLDQGLNIASGGTAPANPLCSNPNKIASQDPAAGKTANSGDTVTVFTGEASPSPEHT